MQLAHGSLRSQRILRVRHWMHESAGRLRRLGSASLRAPGLPADAGVVGAGAETEAGAGAGASGAASVTMSTSMTARPAALGGRDSMSRWSPGRGMEEGDGRQASAREDGG